MVISSQHEDTAMLTLRDGREIAAYYNDCSWLREKDPRVTDCWLHLDYENDEHIELDQVVSQAPLLDTQPL